MIVLMSESAQWLLGIGIGVVVIAVAAVIVITIVLLALRIAKQAVVAEGAVGRCARSDSEARRHLPHQ